MRNELALNSYVNLDNDEARKRNSWKMLLGFVILTVMYALWPVISRLSRIGYIKDLLIAVLILVLAPLLIHFCCTTKVLRNRMHFDKVQKIWSWILLIVSLPYINSILLVPIIQSFRLSVTKIFSMFVMALMAGIIEELLFRGLLFNCLLSFFYHHKYHFIIAGVVSSVLFGCMHLINLTHQPLQSTIGQIIFAFTTGLILIYLRLLSNNIVWCMVLHFFIDFKPVILTSNTGSHNNPIGKIFLAVMPLMILALICIWLFNRQYLKLNH